MSNTVTFGELYDDYEKNDQIANLPEGPYTLRVKTCKARKTDGSPCPNWAMIGQLVCSAHGGRAAQSKAKAAERVDNAYKQYGGPVKEAQRQAANAEVFKNTPPDLLMKIGAQLHSPNELPMVVEASSEPVYHCCYSLIFGDKTKPGHIEIPISGGRYDRGNP